VEAEQACVHARQLTWHLLTFAKGGVPIKKTLTLPRILQDSAHLVLRGSNIACTFQFAPDLRLVHADGLQLVQVFTNILLNALEAMPNGGAIHVSAENVAEIGTRSEHERPIKSRPYVKISITDTGIGIPKENLGSIFDPYFSTKQRGSGLGLASSHSIVKNHGGYISVESTLGRGTMVCVSLPASDGRDADDAPDPPRIAHGRNNRILVMDDEAAIRTLTANMLEFLGYDAEVVSNGSAAARRYARAKVKGRPFDSVILDLIVPGSISGKETMERLIRIDPAVKAILVSGYAQDVTMTDFRAYGFTAALPKPFTLDELSRTLRSIHH
jgi:two-component system cell cycle sensor histidine kinase/response regulator CckA